uniref:Uncharacterized protein n=1 Tax=viral metagenome TaxID=1070528 RepID=A0A6H1Z737_9ZZZZ
MDCLAECRAFYKSDVLPVYQGHFSPKQKLKVMSIFVPFLLDCKKGEWCGKTYSKIKKIIWEVQQHGKERPGGNDQGTAD